MTELTKAAAVGEKTPSGMPIYVIPFSSLGLLSKGALQALVQGLNNGVLPTAAKGIHRNEWGYLPGNSYSEPDDQQLLTIVGTATKVAMSACQFQEYYFDDGNDLKLGKNADRRIVYDQQNRVIYLTMVHYDRYVQGPRNKDGSPKGNAKGYNPFLRITQIP